MKQAELSMRIEPCERKQEEGSKEESKWKKARRVDHEDLGRKHEEESKRKEARGRKQEEESRRKKARRRKLEKGRK